MNADNSHIVSLMNTFIALLWTATWNLYNAKPFIESSPTAKAWNPFESHIIILFLFSDVIMLSQM